MKKSINLVTLLLQATSLNNHYSHYKENKYLVVRKGVVLEGNTLMKT